MYWRWYHQPVTILDFVKKNTCAQSFESIPCSKYYSAQSGLSMHWEVEWNWKIEFFREIVAGRKFAYDYISYIFGTVTFEVLALEKNIKNFSLQILKKSVFLEHLDKFHTGHWFRSKSSDLWLHMYVCTKNPNLVRFSRDLKRKIGVYFKSIWYIIWLFSIFWE
jgi:hypothetical protein